MTVGVLDAFTGTSTNNSRGTEADGTFSSAAVAVNRYTGERVPVSGYARSFDTYDLGAGTDTINAGGGTQALFFSTAGSTRTDANGTNVASPAHFTSVEIFALGFGGDLLDLTAGGGGASSYAVGCAIYGDSPAAVTGTGQGPLGHDVLWGGAGDDTIFADAGGTMTNIVGSDDRLHGGAGADTLYGEAPTVGGSAACGADTLEGGAGNDTLHGDAATFSSYTGARGADDFVFRDDSGRDTIGDFQVGVDDIRISTAYGFDEFSDLTITGTTDAVISLDGTSDRITLTGVAPGSLTAADVEFFA